MTLGKYQIKGMRERGKLLFSEIKKTIKTNPGSD